MRPWRSSLLVLALSLALLPATAFAQSPTESGHSLEGEWRLGTYVLVIDQKGMDVRGAWKESYTDRDVTCSGIWFEGTIKGDRGTGSRHPCGGGR